MAHNPMTYQGACRPGWHFDPVYQQPVYLFWCEGQWWSRYIWQPPITDIASVTEAMFGVQDMVLLPEIYQRLFPLSRVSDQDYISQGGTALRDLYGLRALVEVTSSRDGHGIYIHAPAVAQPDQQHLECNTIWIADDEIPTIIRALQARRRAVLNATTTPETQVDEP
jgi:hypothetical protein